MKVDIHAHVVLKDYLDALAEHMGLAAIGSDGGQTLLRKGNTTVAWFREDFFDIDARIKKMDELGIDMRILSLSSPSIYEWPAEAQITMARQINDELARACAKYPARLKGLAVLPLADMDAALAELPRALDEIGLLGVSIGSHIGGKPLNHPDFEPLWAALNQRKVPVVEHPMPPLGAEHLDEFELPLRVGFIYETTTALTRLIYAGVFERYPDIRFVAPHTGGSILPLLERLDNGYRLFADCRKHISRLPSEYARQIYYDTCSFSRPMLMLAHELVGPEHLLWGTDDPFIGADSAHVDKLDLAESSKRLILGENAKRIFGLR